MRIPRLLSIALAAVLVAASSVAFAREEPVEPPVPVVLSPDDGELEKINAALAQLEELEKAKKKDEAAKLRANLLHTMTERRHEDFHDFILESLKSKSDAVKAEAFRAAAAHELKEAEKLAKSLVIKKQKKRRGRDVEGDGHPGGLIAAALDYMTRMDVKGAEKSVVETHLPSLYISEQRTKARWAPELLRACIHYIGKRKIKAAVKDLVGMVERPEPENPNSPTNPPAAYWEARFNLWAPSEAWVRWALKEITGEEYRTAAEWKVWYEINEKDYD